MTEGMGGTGQDMGWDGEGSDRRKGGREERGYIPQTSIPSAATGPALTISRYRSSAACANSPDGRPANMRSANAIIR